MSEIVRWTARLSRMPSGASGLGSSRSMERRTSRKTRFWRQEPSSSCTARLPPYKPPHPFNRRLGADCRSVGRRLLSLLRRGPGRPPRLNPILASLAVATLAVFLVGTSYFHAEFGGGWLDA